MQELTIQDYPHQVFTALLDGTRAEFDLQYNSICDRWFFNLSVDDDCVGAYKIINNSLLVRSCGPSEFGDLIALGDDLGRNGLAGGDLKLYYVTPAEAEALRQNGY